MIFLRTAHALYILWLCNTLPYAGPAKTDLSNEHIKCSADRGAQFATFV